MLTLDKHMQIPRNAEEENSIGYVICAIPKKECADARENRSEQRRVVPNGAIFEIRVFEDDIVIASGCRRAAGGVPGRILVFRALAGCRCLGIHSSLVLRRSEYRCSGIDTNRLTMLWHASSWRK